MLPRRAVRLRFSGDSTRTPFPPFSNRRELVTNIVTNSRRFEWWGSESGAFFGFGGGVHLNVEVLSAHEDAEQREADVIAQRHGDAVPVRFDGGGIEHVV